MLIDNFTPKQQNVLRQLDVGQYAGQSLIAHAPIKESSYNYYVIHIDLKTNNWRYQADEPLDPSEVADLLKAGGLKTTSVRHQYVLNSAVFKRPVYRLFKTILGQSKKIIKR